MELSEEEIGGGIPDVDHVDMVMDGVIDMVAGNEGYGLSHAQQYLAGALYASGSITFTQYHGNEGIVDSVKAGFKKAWDYIVKMFKQIWGYFFKTGAKKKAAEAQNSLRLLEKSASFRPTGDNARTYVRELIKHGAKMSHMSTGPVENPRAKAEMEAGLEEARQKEKALKDATPVEAVVIAHEVEKVIIDSGSLLLQERAESVANRIEKDIAYLLSLKQQMVAAGNRKSANLENEWTFYLQEALQRVVNGMNSWPPVLRDFKSMKDASRFAGKTRSCVTAVIANMDDFIDSEMLVREKMMKIEHLVKQATIEDEGKRELQESLSELKKVISVSSSAATIINDFLCAANSMAVAWTIPV